MKKVFLAALVFAGATTFAQAQEKKEMKTTSQNKETATETTVEAPAPPKVEHHPQRIQEASKPQQEPQKVIAPAPVPKEQPKEPKVQGAKK